MNAAQFAHDQGLETCKEIALESKSAEIVEELKSGGSVWAGDKWYGDDDVLALMYEAGHTEAFAIERENAANDIERADVDRRYLAQLEKSRAELADEIAEDVLDAQNAAAQGF